MTRVSRTEFFGFLCSFDGSLPGFFSLFRLLLGLLVYEREIVYNKLKLVSFVEGPIFEKHPAHGWRCQCRHKVFCFSRNCFLLLNQIHLDFVQIDLLFWFHEIQRIFVLDHLLLNEYLVVHVFKRGVVVFWARHFQLKRM